MYCNYEQNDWADLLDTAAFVYNNTVHNSIGVSPFFACYGWNPKAHPDIPRRLGVNDPGRFEYLMDGKEHCKYLQEQIREAQRRSVDQYNRKHKDIEFKVGDMVYINRRNWKTWRPTPKLDTRFAGPYPVQERVGCQAYRITLPANLRVHDVFHVSMLEPARTSSLPQRAEQPTIPSLPDEDLDFEVKALIDKRSHNGTTEYKVLWRGYSEEAASWEPVENLNCPDLIQEYETDLGFRRETPDTSLVKPIERFKKFELPEEAQQAFHKLIQAFTSAGVLQHFDYHLPTRLETDASDFAIAGVLKQEHEGRWHPVAFYSRKMSSAEKNYEIHDKELLAVVACLTQWRHMLAGLPSQLVILTDHEALKYFKSQRRITGRQARWAILLADFDFILQYRPGDKGGEPDALTRRTDMQPAGEEQDHNSIASKGLRDLVKIFQPLDQELQEIHTKKPFEVKDNLWYSGGRLVIPKVIMPGRTNN
ncbi:hypothetical protein NDA17_003326 [Ustilago hordei]|nr:hypothetical protein NDA17_003326 [Ustilago hordei]